jgi:phospho-N-acetylmuramoyl-pentapeptide-transferase
LVLSNLVAIPFGAAFLFSVLLGPSAIAALRRRNVGQVISQDGPESHKLKAGTPTMGGIIILGGILAAVLAVAWLSETRWGLPLENSTFANHDLFAVLLLMIAYALVGMADDYLTIRPRGGVRGISSKPKAAAQLLLAAAFVIWLATHRPAGFLPVLMVGGHTLLAGNLYWAFAVLFIAGMANFVNITDGLDGLVAGLTAIAASAFGVCIVMVMTGGFHSDADLSLYAMLPAIAGACVAFLWFNTNPAKVFMGDTGSLALGVGLPAIAILAHREVLLIVVGSVFILDGLSSALQWAVFKYTRVTTGTGRRVFKKSPIHHHFELSGWPEQTIVVRFWILGAVAAVVGFAGAVWRVW